MFAFQNASNDIAPDAMATNASASHAMIHMLSSESPRSAGMSRPRPSAIGHVMTTVRTMYAIDAATVWMPRRRNRSGTTSGARELLRVVGDVVVDRVQFVGRREEDDTEVAAFRRQAEA